MNRPVHNLVLLQAGDLSAGQESVTSQMSRLAAAQAR